MPTSAETLTADSRPHCLNGWDGTPKHPACNYTGGHFCDRLAHHQGPCRCVCGSTSRPPARPPAGQLLLSPLP